MYRFAIHFEDKSLEPALVKPQNLRVVFDFSAGAKDGRVDAATAAGIWPALPHRAVAET